MIIEKNLLFLKDPPSDRLQPLNLQGPPPRQGSLQQNIYFFSCGGRVVITNHSVVRSIGIF